MKVTVDTVIVLEAGFTTETERFRDVGEKLFRFLLLIIGLYYLVLLYCSRSFHWVPVWSRAWGPRVITTDNVDTDNRTVCTRPTTFLTYDHRSSSPISRNLQKYSYNLKRNKKVFFTY